MERWLRPTPLDEEHARVLDRIRRWLGDNRLLPYNPSDWDLRVFQDATEHTAAVS